MTIPYRLPKIPSRTRNPSTLRRLLRMALKIAMTMSTATASPAHAMMSSASAASSAGVLPNSPPLTAPAIAFSMEAASPVPLSACEIFGTKFIPKKTMSTMSMTHHALSRNPFLYPTNAIRSTKRTNTISITMFITDYSAPPSFFFFPLKKKRKRTRTAFAPAPTMQSVVSALNCPTQ